MSYVEGGSVASISEVFGVKSNISVPSFEASSQTSISEIVGPF